MAPRPLLLVASLALGCAEPEIRGPDAATTADVAALDLPTPGDAPDAELFVDASPLDAPSVDVPSVDAPVVDVPPLEDFSLGPYPSALAILLPSLRSNARAYDSSRTFGHSAAQGYVLQAIARTLQAARGRALPGGEAVRDELVALAIGEADELVRGSSRVRGGAPGYGLDEPWDAFGDGSTNPAFTNYAWQTGMVATGLGELLLYLRDAGARHAAREADAQRLTRFLGELVRPWATRSTTVPGASPAAAWYWYSFEPADAKNTHNTSALISTATWMLGSLVGDAALQARARAGSEALRIRLRTGPRGYVWNYVDDGYPTSLRDAEDISHALLTTQFMRFARDRAWFTDGHMAAVAGTFLGQVWSGNPARLHGRVDGSSGGDAEWTWTRAAAIGMAAHGDAPGGLPELYDYARSVAVSSRLTRFAVPRAGGTVDSVGANLLATLMLHRPRDFAPDSRWSRRAVGRAGVSSESAPPSDGARGRRRPMDAHHLGARSLRGLRLPALGAGGERPLPVHLPSGGAPRRGHAPLSLIRPSCAPSLDVRHGACKSPSLRCLARPGPVPPRAVHGPRRQRSDDPDDPILLSMVDGGCSPGGGGLWEHGDHPAPACGRRARVPLPRRHRVSPGTVVPFARRVQHLRVLGGRPARVHHQGVRRRRPHGRPRRPPGGSGVRVLGGLRTRRGVPHRRRVRDAELLRSDSRPGLHRRRGALLRLRRQNLPLQLDLPLPHLLPAGSMRVRRLRRAVRPGRREVLPAGRALPGARRLQHLHVHSVGPVVHRARLPRRGAAGRRRRLQGDGRARRGPLRRLLRRRLERHDLPIHHRLPLHRRGLRAGLPRPGLVRRRVRRLTGALSSAR